MKFKKNMVETTKSLIIKNGLKSTIYWSLDFVCKKNVIFYIR